jgi:hypothetical protein
MWNVFGIENRTINMCKGFHMAMNNAVNIKHPSLYRLIETLKEVEMSHERVLAQHGMGAEPKK